MDLHAVDGDCAAILSGPHDCFLVPALKGYPAEPRPGKRCARGAELAVAGLRAPVE